MSHRIIKTPRVLHVVRAIIVGRSPHGENEYLLFQRAKKLERYPRCWECIGKRVDPTLDRKAIHALIRGGLEEASIPIHSVVKEVYQVRREWVEHDGKPPQYDEYFVRFFIVDTRTIQDVRLSDEHSGCGWFQSWQIPRLRPVIRPSTFDALAEVELIPSEELTRLFHINPRHK